MSELCFAAIKKQIVDSFIEDTDDFRAGLLDPSQPHYDDKALTLFLLLRFYANSSFELYTNEVMLCELMGLSNRAENRDSIMSNIYKMEEDDYIFVIQHPGKKFFRIQLAYEWFMPETDFVIIYKQEFDQLIKDKSKDKLLLLLYCIKKFQHKNTGISFPSVETLMDSSHISKPTVCKGLERLSGILYVYKIRINFNDGTFKDINYYKSRAENGASQDAITSIAKKYYTNIKSIVRRE